MRRDRPSRWHIKKQRGPFICQSCGNSYYTKRPKGEGEKYCGRDCAFAHRATAPSCSVYTGYCVVCDGPIVSKRMRTYCGNECRKAKGRHNYYRIYKPKHNPIECSECGVLFTPLDGARKMCSKPCDRKRSKKIYGSTHRHRAKHYGVSYEPVNVMKVFERDNWTCQLCGEATPKELRGTMEDNAPELDHADPLSRGGPHSYDNVQCACRACNILKGAMTNDEYHHWNQSHTGAIEIATTSLL